MRAECLKRTAMYVLTKTQTQCITGVTNTMRTIRIKLYKFSELSKEAQNRAVLDHITEFLLEDTCNWDEESVYYPALVEMEKMQTPWFLGETLYHDYRNEIITDIEANEYEFTKDGKLA